MQRIANPIAIQDIKFIDYICPNCGSNSFYIGSSNQDDVINNLPNRDQYHKVCSQCKTIYWDMFKPHFEITLEDDRVFTF